MPVRKSCLYVQLECTCTREQLVGVILCFLHHCQDDLRRNQESSLLHTLCSGSYLNVEKTSRCIQMLLVKAAWQVIPQSQHCWLTVLPSSCSCKLQLKNASEGTLSIEMRFELWLDDSDDFRTIKRNFLLLLDDSLRQLCCCLEEKCLNHLLFSKKKVPEEMVLSLAFCMASMLKLSQHLTQEMVAHAQVLQEFEEL
ncbi:inositol 1,4,5-trisphosphate receptor-interacting protein-like 1 [Grus japonensis]|uniref:Inositol 1,4,5-trisphosphate receptor-interacting protein-like 1 n=1 Tax=Grus japonensis TaxID=30415 RepID=A0ABC9VXE5_GRUJA